MKKRSAFSCGRRPVLPFPAHVLAASPRAAGAVVAVVVVMAESHERERVLYGREAVAVESLEEEGEEVGRGLFTNACDNG